MENRKMVPEIRFSGFTDPWEQRKLDEFVSFYNGLTYSPNDIRPNGTLVLRSSNVKDGEIVDEDNVYVDPIVVNSENVCYGDIIVVVRNGSRNLIGKHAEIKESKLNTVIGAFMTGIRSEYPSFLNALLNTAHFDKEIEMNMGATINQITGYMFSKMKFMIPSSKEQDIIGAYFKKLDQLITLHQRKLEKLKTFKKAMLDKMFPKNGELVPEIRFSGFTDPWKQCKLKDFADYKSSSLTAKDCKEEGKYDLYDANQIIGKTDNFVIDKDYITIIKDGAGVGRTRKLPKNTAFIGTMGALTVNNSDLDFLYATLNRIDWNTKTSGSTIPHIYFKDYGEEVYGAPSIEEQKKIGLYFKNIDYLITLHQRKLEKLQNIKKSMLNKMFI